MADEEERVLSVFELAQGLKRTVETATQGRWVEGEVGRLQCPASGHLYFTLKDERRDATVDCVMYKRDAFRFGRRIQEGGRVQLRGRATFYPPRGRLQWICEVARPAGQGALLEALEKLKKKLVEEGLTSVERKRPLPSEPRVVGVVTSRTGAAISDIVTVARRRGPVRIVLSPAMVQGDGAALSLISALELLERTRPDVIIFGRGGGSAEDLMAFNDERVVRRVAACSVPIVSAVGHEIDTSLTDLVADARAATPSQAAEMVVPDAAERRRTLAGLRRHLVHSIRATLAESRVYHDRCRRKLTDPRFVLAEHQQGLDELSERLSGLLKLRLKTGHVELARSQRRLYARHPRAVLATARAELGPLRQRLVVTLPRKLDGHSAELGRHARALTALSPLAVLGRGYSITKNEHGRAIRDVAEVHQGQLVTIRVHKGSFFATVGKVLSTVENHSAFDQESLAAAAAGEEEP